MATAKTASPSQAGANSNSLANSESYQSPAGQSTAGQMEDSGQSLNSELLAELKALRARVEQLEHGHTSQAHAAPSSIVSNSQAPTAYERNLAKLNHRLAQQKHHAEQAEALLEEGQFKFSISVEKEPMMTRIVGATTNSEHEAIRKYNTYFGIRSSNKAIKAVPASEGEVNRRK